jgi:uncharacterized protein
MTTPYGCCSVSEPLPSEPLPGVPARITPETAPFWTAGAGGELVVEQCTDCGLHIFPPRGVCRGCYGRELRFVPVRPPGVVYARTVNHNAWYPDGPSVFPLVLVDFPDYSGVRFVGRCTGSGDAIEPGDTDTLPKIDDLVGFELVPAFDGRFQLVFSPWKGTA